MPLQVQKIYEEVQAPTLGSGQVFEETHQLRYLRPDEYSRWDELIDVSPQGTVLCRPWLLRALGGDIRILAYFRGDQLVAGIPLYFDHSLGFSVCRMPKLVHTWGVAMEPLKGKRVAVISREVDILSVFARELSKQRIFVQSFHPTIANWLPFMWNGFRQTTYFGYAFEHLSQLDLLWKQMSDSARRNIRRAERNGIRIIPCDSDLVAGVAEMTFVHQGRALPYSRDYLRYYYAACSARSAGQCFAAVDEKGQVHAAGFLVWDRKRAYYVAGGTDPVLRVSGADSLLTWRMLQFAQERTKSFDFCGSVVKSIATFLRHFGAQLVPYYRISKLPRILRLMYP